MDLISTQRTIGKISVIVDKEIHPSNMNRNEKKEKSVAIFDKKLFLRLFAVEFILFMQITCFTSFCNI